MVRLSITSPRCAEVPQLFSREKLVDPLGLGHRHRSEDRPPSLLAVSLATEVDKSWERCPLHAVAHQLPSPTACIFRTPSASTEKGSDSSKCLGMLSHISGGVDVLGVTGHASSVDSFYPSMDIQ